MVGQPVGGFSLRLVMLLLRSREMAPPGLLYLGELVVHGGALEVAETL